MTDPLPSLNDPVPDRGHEALRLRLVAAIAQVTDNITQLRADFGAAQTSLTGQLEAAQASLTTIGAALAATQSDVAGLQAAVTALQPAPPDPIPTTLQEAP